LTWRVTYFGCGQEMALPVPRPLPIVCLVIFSTRYVPPYARMGEMAVMPLKKVMPAG